MSTSLIDLIMAYGDARADWAAGGGNRVPGALTDARERIEAIEDAAIQIGIDGETIRALLDGDDQ